MSHVLPDFPLLFQRFPFAPRNSVRHERDMERTCERNFVFFPQCSHSKVRISPTKPAGSGEYQTARAFSPHRRQTIGLMWASGIYVNALRRTGIVLFRIRKYSLVAGP
jgi:hypothetical protein